MLSKLFVYLDREMDGLVEADIEAHLHECRECFRRAEFEKALKRKIAASADIVTPEDTRERLEALIKRF